MPYTLLNSMIKQLEERWTPLSDAQKISTKHLQSVWMLEEWTMKSTELWKQRDKLDWNTRKIQRKAKQTWLPEYYFTVNMKGNVVRNKLFI